MADALVGIRQSTGADRPIDTDSDGSKYRQIVWDRGPIGTWGYTAGVSGTVTLTGGKRVLGLTVTATSGGAFTINGGATITIPTNGSLEISPKGTLTDPVFVFTSTTAYFIEYIA